MAEEIKLTDVQLTIKAIVRDGVRATDDRVLALARTIRQLHQAIGAGAIRFQTTGTPNLYAYEWTLADGRSFKQTFRFDGNAVYQTFDVAGLGFLESEFMQHRALRALILASVGAIGLADLKCDWT